MFMLHRRAQGAFEYVLLLAGILLIVVVVISVLRVSVIPAANQTLASGLQQWQQVLAISPTLGYGFSFSGCSGELCDGATVTFGQAIVPEQTVVTVYSPPWVFNGSIDAAPNMTFAADNQSVFVNVGAKYGEHVNTSQAHVYNVFYNGSYLIPNTTITPLPTATPSPCPETNESCGSPGSCTNCSASSGFYGSSFCVGSNQTREYRTYYCSNNSCTYYSTNVTNQTCTYGCSAGTCNPAPPDNAPGVFLTYPQNGGSLLLVGDTPFSFIPSDDRGFTSATLYGNFTGSWTAFAANQTSVTNNSVNYVNASISNGTYSWNVRVCDNATPTPQCAYAPSNYSLTLRSLGATSSVAGNGTAAYGEGVGSSASFNAPYGVAVSGNYLYVADTSNNRIRRIDLTTNATSLVAGNGVGAYGEGVGSSAYFYSPASVAVSGNYLYVADSYNYMIRRIDLTTNATSLVAGSGTSGYAEGVGSSASFSNLAGVAVSGNYLYVADYVNHRIRRIDLTTNATSLVAGNGTGAYAEGVGSNATFFLPYGVAVSGNYLYVADKNNHRIRRIDLTTNATSLVAGGSAGYAEGVGSNAQFQWPYGVAVSGNYLYVADLGNNRIRRIDLTTNATSLVAGGSYGYAEGVGSSASFKEPYGVAASGNYLYVADNANNRIRRIA
jgi:hypothetical protein